MQNNTIENGQLTANTKINWKMVLCAFFLIGGLFVNIAFQNVWVAKVNGEKITEDQFKERAKLIVWLSNGQFDPDQAKTMILDNMTEELVFIQAARKEKVDIDDEQMNTDFDAFLQQMLAMYGSMDNIQKSADQYGLTLKDLKEAVRGQYLIQGLMDKLADKVTLTDSEKKEANEKYKGYKEVQASHILVSDRKKADKILAEIRGGLDFNEAAKKYTEEPGGKERAGDLGYFTQGEMVEPIETAAFALKVGEVSEVVQTQFGFHIIKVFDIRGPEYLAKQEKASAAQEAFLKDIVKKAKIVKKSEAELPQIMEKEKK